MQENCTGMDENTMNSHTLMKGAFLAFCLAGLLVLPAAAAGQAPSTADQGLKNDLWSSQGQYRLSVFDMNVQHANDVIGILNQYSIDTTQMQSTLTQISAERPALQSAFTNQDRSALGTVNQQLATLWKQYMQEVQAAVRGHYARASPATVSAATGAAGLQNTNAGEVPV